MNQEILVIAGTAASIGFVHTLLGPDHYLPFVVIARARHWRLSKTLVVSSLCGLGHVLSSVILGLVGIALGMALFKLENIESFREGLAAWMLIGFGFIYLLWGMYAALNNRPHRRLHGPGNTPGSVSDTDHPSHDEEEHSHSHGHGSDNTTLTPWVLFIIFVFGPCKPLIPIIMYPAAQHSGTGVFLVAAAYGVSTIIAMLVVISLMSLGIRIVKLGRLERWIHAIAGALIMLAGVSVKFLGL